MLLLIIPAAPVIPSKNTHNKIENINSHIGIKAGKKAQVYIYQDVNYAGRVNQNILFAGKPYTQNAENNGNYLNVRCVKNISIKLLCEFVHSIKISCKYTFIKLSG